MALTGVFVWRVSQTKGKVRLRQPLRGAHAYAKTTLDLALEFAAPWQHGCCRPAPGTDRGRQVQARAAKSGQGEMLLAEREGYHLVLG
jgi:hypothetical protein